MALHVISAAATVLHSVTAWLHSKQTDTGSTKASTMFIFEAGSRLRGEEHGMLQLRETCAVERLSHADFVERLRANPTSCIKKIPLNTPDAPLSRKLHSTEVIAELGEQSLSSIFGQGSTYAWASGMTADDYEYLAWSLMDHVLGYPYYHPDGYVRGTNQFHAWRILIQKQYALLLLCQIILADHVKKLHIGVCDTFRNTSEPQTGTMQGVRKGKDRDPVYVDAALNQAEKEYRLITKKIRTFQNEQRMLRKAFHRTIDTCIPYSHAELCSTVKSHVGGKCVSSQPFNPGRKHGSSSPLVRSSKDRSRHMGLFLRSQKKRRRTIDHSNPIEGLPGAHASVEPLRPKNMSGIDHPSDEDACEKVIFDSAGETKTRYGADANVTLDGSPALIEGDLDVVTLLLFDMSVTNEEIKVVANDLAGYHLLTAAMDDMDEIDALIAGLEWEIKEVKEVCESIASELKTSEVRESLSIEEVNMAIPGQGMY